MKKKEKMVGLKWTGEKSVIVLGLEVEPGGVEEFEENIAEEIIRSTRGWEKVQAAGRRESKIHGGPAGGEEE